MTSLLQRHQRLLVIDDNVAIHSDFRKILGKPDDADLDLQEAEARLFGTTTSAWFDVDFASQGEEGFQMVEQSLAEARPYSMAFVDMRMPPGWDGVETTRRIWDICPDIQIVICTAYADCNWSDLMQQLNARDRLLVLKKPFDSIELLQQANALTEKWRLQQESNVKLDLLDHLVRQRTRELEHAQQKAFVMMEDAMRNREKEQQAYEDLKREVAERQKLEEHLREKASLLDKARDAIIVRDLGNRVTYWNKSAQRLYGWTVKEAMGQHTPELLHKDTEEFDQAHAKLLQNGEWVGELRQRTKDGRPLLVEARWTLVRNADGQPSSILAINTDITHQKTMENQFLRAQRMESLGALAGGIAHDLNNVLTPITMAIDFLRLKVTDPKCADVLNTISSSARRGADMVGQVLSFARGLEGRRMEVHPRQVISDVEKICSETFPKNVEVHTSMEKGLWCILGDPTQVHQVLLNLCVNARDAMPTGGQIKIQARNVMLDERFVSLNLEATAGPHVLIEVEDTGTGMPHEVVEKIFDPFFTTKELGRGTGLGLSTSLSIVKSHGGFMQVDSEPRRGTCFRLYLPAITTSSASHANAGEDLPRGNGETVLVIDDESFVRQITRQTLEAFGYKVILAAEGAEGVTLYAKHKDEINIVLTDMMMPVMDGMSTIMVLKKMNPAVRIVAASGVTPENYATSVERVGVKHFIPKPYNAHTLLTLLKQVLQEAPRS